MPKASFVLPNGTTVNIEGSVADIQELLTNYGGHSSGSTQRTGKKIEAKPRHPSEEHPKVAEDYIAKIVNEIKQCDEAEDIEKNILDRSSRVDKILLPLYIVHQYMDNSIGLQSGEISKIAIQLGIPISQPNSSMALAGIASRYVMGNKVRKAKMAVKYKLNRRGVIYIQSVIKGKPDEE
jgi:hypothetical protein